MQAQLVIEHLMQLGDPIRAQTNLRFFKTAEGEYGGGDHFFGITMPKLRGAVKEHREWGSEEENRRMHEQCRPGIGTSDNLLGGGTEL